MDRREHCLGDWPRQATTIDDKPRQYLQLATTTQQVIYGRLKVLNILKLIGDRRQATTNHETTVDHSADCLVADSRL